MPSRHPDATELLVNRHVARQRPSCRWLLLFVVSAAAGDRARAVEIIAHRGESADAPENTLAAFRLAWERRVTAIELDVHLTKDDRLVVCHDADTKRTTGETLTIAKSTLADLRTLDAGRWKGERWTGGRLRACRRFHLRRRDVRR
jgi:glycerophosphoryl diester phosphodiesterase